MSTPERSNHLPRLKVRELVFRLPEREHLDLANAVGVGCTMPALLLSV